MSILIVDHGLCNLDSVKRALEECGATVYFSNNPLDLKSASKVVLPGVGSFGEAMQVLAQNGWVEPLRKAALVEKIPFIGMCLGMQLMASSGVEAAVSSGLNLIAGQVVPLQPTFTKEKIPHMGWNEVKQIQSSPIFKGIDSGKDFYFAHSFHFVPQNPQVIVAKTPYCGDFVSAIADQNIFGLQFHPEKSQRVGMQLLKNFVEL